MGFLAGGFFVDRIFEPLMAGIKSDWVIAMLFGSGKGSGAAMLFFYHRGLRRSCLRDFQPAA